MIHRQLPARSSGIMMSAIVFCWVAVSMANPVSSEETDGFPLSIERCRFGDTKCLAVAMTRIFAEYPEGIPEIGLGSLDPFQIAASSLGNGGKQQNGALVPINLNVTMTNIQVRGWKKLQVIGVIGFEKDPRNSRFVIKTRVDKETLTGKYNLNGQILVLPIRGHGIATITFGHIEMDVTLHTSVVTRPADNEDYLHVDSVTVAVNARSMGLNFTNLFKDKALSDNMNAVLNDNSKLLIPEFRPSMARSFEVVLKQFIPPIFERFPYRQFFADDSQQ